MTSKDERGELTASHAADVLGKQTTSSAVEHVLSQPDPWAALDGRLEWSNAIQAERQEAEKEAGG